MLAFIVLTLLQHPEKTLAYVTYEDRTAKSKSRKARMLAEACGVRLAKDSKSLNEWRTPEGGGLLATGIGGPLTSQGVDILLIDDPYKNRVQAESGAYRKMVADWHDDVAETRLEPGGSAFIFHTRWTSDDLIAYVHGKKTAAVEPGESGNGYRHILLPALSAEGEALWPNRWTKAALEEKRLRVGEFTWASLYQGMPRPRGGRVFNDVHEYTVLPEGCRASIGVDLAYTAKTSSDHSVALVLKEKDGTYYVTDVVREQMKAPLFAKKLKLLSSANVGARMRWYAAGVERGAGDFIINEGVPLEVEAPKGDKFVRAQPLAAAWNAGKVRIPVKAPWANDLTTEFGSFTGLGDAEDDQVDAGAAAFDLLNERSFTVATPELGADEPTGNYWSIE